MKLLRYLIIWLLLTMPSAHAQSSASALEYKVKAVVLVNFAKYVKWPAQAFETKDEPIKVCLYGENPFGKIFDAENAPKEAQGRPLAIEVVPSDAPQETLAACQILYWGSKHGSTVEALLPALHQKGVLSVSDKDSDYAFISFVLESGKVRFKIRYKAAQERGFEMSSQLLKLATEVE